MPHVSRATSFLALALCAGFAASCGDPFTIRAPFSTATDSFSIAALTRTPIAARSLWRIGGFSRYRLDSIAAAFDIGFDIDAAGRVIVYPARTIAVPPAGTPATPPQVGLQLSTEPYATVDRAPEAGYRVDTALVVSRGQTVLVRSASDVCLTQNTGATLLYAKFVVDSIDVLTRNLVVRATVQQSCNFRSFATGIPEF